MNYKDLINEVTYKAVRSSGAGGQNVNKVATQVELYFDVNSSVILSQEQKEKLHVRLSNKISKEGLLMIACQESRSQAKNKELVTRKFLDLITAAMKEQKKRRKSGIPTAVKEKRLKLKRINSEVKRNRGKYRGE
jgi:ribosome-associated protein